MNINIDDPALCAGYMLVAHKREIKTRESTIQRGSYPFT